jgi:hypothetical protein
VTEQPSESEVIAEVHWRFRICNYLFTLAIAWIVVGYLGPSILKMPDQFWVFTVISVTGFGIFSAACALTLAIYRCPICDSFIHRLRRSKEHCSTCGAKIR